MFQRVTTAQGISDKDKVVKIVSCVTDLVKVSAQRFHDFVDVLKLWPYFHEIVQKLNSTYH